MNTGYVIAQHNNANNYFTTTSSYDRPRWIPITEASVYQTVELAQLAVSKLWRNGAYSAKLVSVNEVYNEPNAPVPPSIGDSGDDYDYEEYGDEQFDPEDSDKTDQDNEYGDEQFDDEPEMKAGTLDDDDDDENEINLDDDDIESMDEVETEENEQSFLSPIERNMMRNKRSVLPSGNGPMKEGISPTLRNTQSDTSLTKPASTKGHRGVPGPQKISDAEVRQMRCMYEMDKKPKSTIYDKWDNVEHATIDKILSYTTRLGAKCDIDYKEKPTKKVTENKTIATDLPKPKKIKIKQQVGEPADVDFTKGLDSMHNPNKTPVAIIKALKDSIKEFQDVADFNNGKDDSQASMAMTIGSALTDILADLQQDTLEGLKAAQIRITTYMNPITTHFPPTVIDYLYKSGRQPISLKNMFYDNWGTKRKEDQNY